ncbi:MAG: M1 family metallopeptidase [Bacteroidales bacterium]|nr:M1 family metallopeptidase [Bacteroidales bacterium]
MQKAIQKGTRTLLGMPGKNYWQNHADYKIKVRFDPESAMVSGIADITYFNESPDTLNYLVFNLYQDIFRKGNSRNWDIGSLDLHDGTTIISIKIGDQLITSQDKKWNRQGTKLTLKLDRALGPESQIQLSVDWELKIAEVISIRMGKYSDSSFFIAYWYPQIAVYDDIYGWDKISYGGSVEFYNDVNNFDVTIEVPKNWVVWATGELQNKSEVFHQSLVEKIEHASQSDSIVKLINQSDYLKNRVFRSNDKQLTYHFMANAVPDFSFAAAQGFNWDASRLYVNTRFDKAVFISAVYPEKALSGQEIARYSRQSIDYMSRFEPGLPFPYPYMTTFLNGRRGGGMETPMMANNGDPESMADAFGLTFHEIAHNYMPFYMGINEKKYAWMDEGWARIWPQLMVDSLFAEHDYLARLVSSYENAAGYENDIPPMIPNHLLAADYSSLRLASYTRPSLAYAFLQDALGAATFKKALHHYMVTWAGKHPLPIDFFRAMEVASNEDLSWFINPWFYQNAYPDLALVKVTGDNQVVVENRGGLPLPVCLTVIYDDGKQQTVCESTAVWKDNLSQCIIRFDTERKIAEVWLGNELIPDTSRENNHFVIGE